MEKKNIGETKELLVTPNVMALIPEGHERVKEKLPNILAERGRVPESAMERELKKASAMVIGGQVTYEMTCKCGNYLGIREHKANVNESVKCGDCGRQYSLGMVRLNPLEFDSIYDKFISIEAIDSGRKPVPIRK